MGYEREYAIVVSSWNAEALAAAHTEALRLFPNTTATTVPAVNGKASFLIPTSGSKLGWPEADDADIRRAQYRTWLLDNARYEDGSWKVHWIEVQYGDDEGEAKIVDASDNHGGA